MSIKLCPNCKKEIVGMRMLCPFCSTSFYGKKLIVVDNAEEAAQLAASSSEKKTESVAKPIAPAPKPEPIKKPIPVIKTGFEAAGKPGFNLNKSYEMSKISLDFVLLKEGESSLVITSCRNKLAKSIVIPSGIVRIGHHAFAKMPNLEQVIFNKELRAIDSQAFADCPKLDITAPSYVTSVAVDAFRGTAPDIREKERAYAEFLAKEKKRKEEEARAIEERHAKLEAERKAKEAEEAKRKAYGIEIRGTDQWIVAFPNKTATSVHIPEGVIGLEEGCFDGCASLRQIYLPSSMSHVNFRRLPSSVASFIVDPKNPNFCVKDGVLYSKDMRRAIRIPPALGLTTYTFPINVTNVEYGFAATCTSIQSIALNNSIGALWDDAFFACTSLTNITWGNAITCICEAFKSCTALRTIRFPETLTSIGWGAFENCTNLTEITITGTRTSVDSHAFTNCYKLKKVYITNGAPVDEEDFDYGVKVINTRLRRWF